MCFNLNLLECKSGHSDSYPQAHWVLISTYWNVNFSRKAIQCAKNFVLISTYWNVNVRAASRQRGHASF